MKLQRNDWLISDDQLKKKARQWWKVIFVGFFMECILFYGLGLLTHQSGLLGVIGFIVILVRIICGSTGFYCWIKADAPPEFWSFQARWLMQFSPAALLSWRRKVWINNFLKKISDGSLEKKAELAQEQYNYYLKGSSLNGHGLDATQREMAGWASAVKECLFLCEKLLENEKMKSPEQREVILSKLGIGKDQVSKTMISLEKIEIDIVCKGGTLDKKKRL